MNYKEEITNGNITSWRRSHRLTISNPYNQAPKIVFDEEDRTAIPDGRSMVTNNTSIEADFDPDKTFKIINPMTGEEIGESNYQNLYVLLFSLYISLANERDLNE